jgi:hypothetical protein
MSSPKMTRMFGRFPPPAAGPAPAALAQRAPGQPMWRRGPSRPAGDCACLPRCSPRCDQDHHLGLDLQAHCQLRFITRVKNLDEVASSGAQRGAGYPLPLDPPTFDGRSLEVSCAKGFCVMRSFLLDHGHRPDDGPVRFGRVLIRQQLELSRSLAEKRLGGISKGIGELAVLNELADMAIEGGANRRELGKMNLAPAGLDAMIG